MGEILILPPNYHSIEGPVIFLAGPIQGAPRWQDDAINLIHSKDPELIIASPRRGNDQMEEDFVYEKQVDWETHFLNRAAQQGVIMFWLAKELKHQCERAYAQTSRFELGEWKAKHQRDGANLVIGIEDGFTNARYIRRRLMQDCPDISVFNSLEATCKEAILVTQSQFNLEPRKDIYSITQMPNRQELEDFLRKGSGEKPKHGGSVSFNIEAGLFERN